MWKEAAMALMKVPSRHSPGEPEGEALGNHSQDGRRQGWNPHD